MIRNAYTSTVLGPVQLGLGLLFATGVAVVAAGIGMSSWLAVLIAGVIVVTGVHLSVVRLSVGGGRVLIGQGPWNRLPASSTPMPS